MRFPFVCGNIPDMYCPRCAQPNTDGAKFCRGCGEDLTVIAQALSKHLSVTLLSKLDEHVTRKNNRIRRDAIMTALSGTFLLLSGIWQLASNSGAWLPAALMLLGALILFLASGWDLLAYKRSLSSDAREQLTALLDTSDLEPGQGSQIPRTSVTEQTTRHLDATVSRTEEL